MRRLDFEHGFAEIAGIDRDLAPAEQRQAFLLQHARDGGAHLFALGGVGRHEELADAVVAGLGQVEAELAAFFLEEAMRDLHENAAAVAELGIGADGAAMVEILENAQAHRDDVVALAVLHVGDEADAAGIVLETRVVHALRFGQVGVAGVDGGHFEIPDRVSFGGGNSVFARSG